MLSFPRSFTCAVWMRVSLWDMARRLGLVSGRIKEC